MRVIRYLLHLIQIVALCGIYELNDLYENHINFMRTIAYFSQIWQQGWPRVFFIILSLVLTLLTVICLWRRRSAERFFLLFITIVLLIWQFGFSLDKIAIYYLILLIILVIYGLQLLTLLFERRS